jgi:hypothetical protein
MSQMFENAVRELDSLLLNRPAWERLDQTRDHQGSRNNTIEWLEYTHPGTDQYVRVEHGVEEDNIVIGARIACTTFRRLPVDAGAMKITISDHTSTRIVHLADLQENRWHGGIALQTKPQTDPYLVQLILAMVVDAAHMARSV